MKQTLHRVLDASPVDSLDDWVSAGGSTALDAARRVGASEVLDALEVAGLRGRGGAGFPTAVKWRTVLEHSSETLPATVVVNAAEGEPGSQKDRHLLLTNPYKVLEGAAVAAHTVGADTVVVATKAAFEDVVARLRDAIDEISASGEFAAEVGFEVVEGPDDYLYGEETALLEVVEGRDPLPRVSPPFRRGVDDPGEHGSSAGAELATDSAATDAAPVLVNNVETLAHVADIMRHGPQWFSELGSPDAGGTFLCTVSGDVETPSVLELPVGSTLADALLAAGGMTGRPLGALLGVSHPLVPAEEFTIPLGYGSDADAIPVGSGAFMFFSEDRSPVAITAGASRFLSDASCAQCEPCKVDGAAISDALEELTAGTPEDGPIHRLESAVATVADGARCALARQHRDIVEGLLSRFPRSVTERISTEPSEVQPVEIRARSGSYD